MLPSEKLSGVQIIHYGRRYSPASKQYYIFRQQELILATQLDESDHLRGHSIICNEKHCVLMIVEYIK